MEPRIQYAKTTDGVSIAFWSFGRGPALVYMPGTFSHLQLEWEIPECRRWLERLAERRTLVRYDPRGQGLSDRDATLLSVDAFVDDLESVVDALALDKFALFAPQHAGPWAVTFVHRHPGRVSHLVLWCTYAEASSFSGSARIQALRAVMNLDWRTYSETAAHVLLGWAAGEDARRFATLIRESTTPEILRASIQAISQADVSGLLPSVTCPTLVLQRREAIPGLRAARSLAAGIRGSRLAVLEGESAAAPYLGDWLRVVDLIDEFLGEDEPAHAAPELPSGTAIILFADIAGSTALTERLGDAAFRGKARELDTALRAVIRENGGTPVEGKLLGDGVLAVFTSARQAIEAALGCGKAGGDGGLLLHLGLHAGDVIREENNVYGGAVNIAARISALSAPGEVLVSDTLRGLARTSAVVAFDDRGEHELKGVGEPQRLFAVRRDDQ